MARWRAWRPAPALLALEAAPLALEATPEALRAYAMDLLRDTNIPTHVVLEHYLARVVS